MATNRKVNVDRATHLTIKHLSGRQKRSFKSIVALAVEEYAGRHNGEATPVPPAPPPDATNN